ncbi:GAF sensor signal transduction histidine kinase [Cnuella takakiae]|uniref:histidine kinase n=1 Tax=Cnuella takakiae TaxID=1302690 RepID=A0A1M5FQQ0_9BACT|nr:GAF domain-containing sensor histidine kinase [Cnuella takakiae]OLY93671.1 hypothetical protein BUE76_18630 [Cnuella takakiae]SHF93833.1 GAF sensor signal transduction histidine kinase [Cnuella takakiae]
MLEESVEYQDTEQKRLKELHELDILDTEEEKEYTDFVEIASGIAGTPISLITLLDENRQWFKAYKGVDFRETPRDIAFCNIAIQQDQHLEVVDATTDIRFKDNPLVTGPTNIQFYAGFPLISPLGNKLGTLCVIDHKPTRLSAAQKSLLEKLADKVVQILELRRKNIELVRLRAEADAKREMMNQLLSNQRKMMSILAHDTKGPLTSMAHLVDMLWEAPVVDEDMKQMACSLMSGQLKVSLELIDNLIAWGATHLSGQLYEEQPYAAEPIARETVATLSRMAEEKGIQVKVDAKGEPLFWLNREVFRFIVRNLVHNALKFTEQGSVTVFLNCTAEASCIRVVDTGIGMPKGMEEKLFTRKMSSREGTRKEPGSGLGLILVHDFVLKLGGSIQVQSLQGQGTTFTISFPLYATVQE